MQVNNLGGARMPVTTTTDSASQTARASFSTRLQGSTGAPTTGRVGVPGSSIISTAITVNSGSIPGSNFGAPYLQAAPQRAGVPGTGSTAPQGQTSGTGSTAPQGQTPATGSAGSEFNGELEAMYAQQKGIAELKELAKMSLLSFVGSTFAMGQNRAKIESLD